MPQTSPSFRSLPSSANLAADPASSAGPAAPGHLPSPLRHHFRHRSGSGRREPLNKAPMQQRPQGYSSEPPESGRAPGRWLHPANGANARLRQSPHCPYVFEECLFPSAEAHLYYRSYTDIIGAIRSVSAGTETARAASDIGQSFPVRKRKPTAEPKPSAELEPDCGTPPPTAEPEAEICFSAKKCLT